MDDSLEKRAEEGDVEAQCNLAFLYEIGLDRILDMEKALFWWQQAAQQGHPIATEKVNLLLGEDQLEKLPHPQSTHTFHTGKDIQTKILLLEDEPTLRAILTKSLEGQGYMVILKENGEEGIKALLSNPDVKVIITDLKMPVMNGMQFIKTLRKMHLAEEAIIVVMTAFSKPELIEAGKKFAVDHWLAKPFEASKLLEAIQLAMSKRLHIA